VSLPGSEKLRGETPIAPAKPAGPALHASTQGLTRGPSPPPMETKQARRRGSPFSRPARRSQDSCAQERPMRMSPLFAPEALREESGEPVVP
jgi:hypothetical protein